MLPLWKMTRASGCKDQAGWILCEKPVEGRKDSLSHWDDMISQNSSHIMAGIKKTPKKYL